ncbi:MAG: protein of unknown function DUF4440 [Verrucomicrobia bacterium]|nr:MAG: protein of unknown function DUF4440 [Verrucomicrobiota bacterium]
MKSSPTVFLLALTLLVSHAAEETRSAKLQAADDARVSATKAADTGKLRAILSEELRYAHSNGLVDTRESFIELVTSGKTKYEAIEYEERRFTFPAPKIALMSGRAHIVAQTGTGVMDSVLSFLAVWREEEDGTWRFLAWQSCRLPPKS